MSHNHVIKTIRRIVKDLAHPNVKEDDNEQLDEIPGMNNLKIMYVL